ncbi:flavoprotein [Clostridium uliginosum]|uniref:Flavoprotein n=1 Tax=Clostridium uliginosum TaxID=119641 RepID=A0A1I1HBU2_9CLOT|nr:flavoprotein [Clostridium uliginosum]SFC18600.1 Flavoprotein [Clostridium uliginosum]
MNLDELVQAVLKEVMAKIDNQIINKSDKKVAVIFTGTTIGLEESIMQIRELKNHGVNMTAVLSQAALNVIDMNVINDIFNLEDIYIDGKCQDNKVIYNEEFDLIICANLSINSIAKIATGISDTLPTAFISKCIINGTKIIVSKNAADLDNLKKSDNSYKKIPIAYINMIKGYLDKLESYGIKLINSIDLFDYAMQDNSEENESIKIKDRIVPKINNENNMASEINSIQTEEISSEYELNKKIISKEDIALNSENKKIVVPSYSIITALARDLADEIGIQIIKR